MLRLLKGWKGEVNIDGTDYSSINEATRQFNRDSSSIHIVLKSANKKRTERNQERSTDTSVSIDKKYVFTVRPYMTKKATPSFDFMAKYNNDVPMPFRTMIGVVKKQTAGMIYAECYADIITEQSQTCLKCGKQIDNPVSKYFGVGPICGGHNYVNPFSSEEELKEAVKSYREELRNIRWDGWIIKSAITSQEEL